MLEISLIYMVPREKQSLLSFVLFNLKMENYDFMISQKQTH